MGIRTPRASEFVYFVRAETTRLIKIGISRDMVQRLKALQTGSPDKLSVMGVIRCERPVDTERAFHAQFRRQHSHGEWFKPSAELDAFIAERAVSLEQDAEHKRTLTIQSWIDRGLVTSESQALAERGLYGNPQAVLATYKATRGLP